MLEDLRAKRIYEEALFPGENYASVVNSKTVELIAQLAREREIQFKKEIRDSIDSDARRAAGR
jgi:hypothetical protein